MIPRFVLLLAVLLIPILPPVESARAEESNPFTAPASNCTASLLANTKAVEPGKPFLVGVRFEMAKGWHLYWEFPGESGEPPKIQWQLPEGFKAGPIQWPLPHSLVTAGVIFTNVYDDELILPVEITPPSQIDQKEIILSAKVRWFICSDSCVPGSAELALTLPVGPGEPDHADLFKRAQAALPQSSPAPLQVTWRRTPNSLDLSVSQIPPDHSLEVFPLPPKGVLPDRPTLTVGSQPGTAEIKIPATQRDPDGTEWRALFVLTAKDQSRRGWVLSQSSPVPLPRPSAEPQKPAKSETPKTSASSEKSGAPSPSAGGLGAVLWGAFLGGLLLNLMPCVLPVIALKIFGFTQQAGQDPRRVLKLGLAFTAGVFAFFLGLAGAVIALKAAGGGLNWGFQFQNPWILLGLISAVFVFGLNLLGVFEITLAGGANAKMSVLSAKQGLGGAFLHGMFTTLLGTSCTAPYLGVTLGFAVSQPAPSVILIFATIAAGMSLPNLLLTANPALLRFLPKPGMWMERLKQGMGFVMLAVAVWLLTVLGDSRGAEILGGTCAYLLLLGVGCWLLGVLRSRAIALILAVSLAVVGYRAFVHEPLSRPSKREPGADTSEWQPFSPEKVAAERAAGRPVFVDFTAEWCLNCKVNERLTLSKAEVREAFKKAGVTLLKADWTDGDKTITEELNRFGRVGVPFYLLYPAKEGEPIVFPELLTPSMVIEAIQKIAPQPK